MAHTPTFARLARIARHALRPHAPHLFESAPESGLTRRAFVGAVGASTLVSACGGDGDEPSEADVQVAVIGAGLAGTHCAYRLAQAGVDVALYEASTRAGGRTFTSRTNHPDGQLCELGGELVDSNHAAMFCLIGELGLSLDDRFAGAASTADVWWVGGVIVPEATIVEQFTAVAPAMAAALTAADADDVAYAELDLTSLAAWLDLHVPSAMYPELHAVLTSAYRGEYGLETAEQSVLNLIYLIGSDEPDPFRIFGDSDERYHCHQGSDAIVSGMIDRLPAGILALDHRLTAIARHGELVELRLQTQGGEVTVLAEHVVLALPFTLLRQVDLTHSGLSPYKLDLIANLGYGTNTKVMAWFTTPVWRTQNGALGGMTGDDATQQGWDSSIGQSGTHGIYTNFLGGQTGVNVTAVAADAWYGETVLGTLEAIWPGTAAAFVPGTITPMHWPSAPFALGSYTCYRPGQWATAGTEGEREGNVHFCGEHCSVDFQGWMEGAAESGALVAAAILEELGFAAPPELACILGVKRVVEQPSFGRLSSRPSPTTRRQRMQELAKAWRCRGD